MKLRKLATMLDFIAAITILLIISVKVLEIVILSGVPNTMISASAMVAMACGKYRQEIDLIIVTLKKFFLTAEIGRRTKNRSTGFPIYPVERFFII